MKDFIGFDYRDWLNNLKSQIKQSHIKANLSVNSQLIMLYWDLGKQIVEKQKKAKWGSGFLGQLSKDLKTAFPEMSGFSKDNLERIRRFYLFYGSCLQTNQISAQLVRKIEDKEIGRTDYIQSNEKQTNQISAQLVRKLVLIPWGHHILIMRKIKDINTAYFYINKTIENNWSRAVLDYQIESDLYKRSSGVPTNFTLTLPTPDSDLANEIVKDEYNFDFLRLSEKVRETDLEKALIQHMTQFLTELGKGFAYMGRQYLLKVGSKEFRTDLLFYHTKLKCYIVIELKVREFAPEFLGKLSFYVTAVNNTLRDESDKPTIGILLCKEKDNVVVDFALESISHPIGVSKFTYTELADEVKAVLPTVEELQDELINFDNEQFMKDSQT